MLPFRFFKRSEAVEAKEGSAGRYKTGNSLKRMFINRKAAYLIGFSFRFFEWLVQVEFPKTSTVSTFSQDNRKHIDIPCHKGKTKAWDSTFKIETAFEDNFCVHSQ